MFRWCDRRLAEAIAAHGTGNWTGWSAKHARRIAKDFVGQGAPLGHLAQILREPWAHEPGFLAEERVRLTTLMDAYLANRKALAVAKWKQQLDERGGGGGPRGLPVPSAG